MRMSFFPKLAWTGMRNNRRLYVPYLLTCIGMVMMYYIVNYLACADALLCMTGGEQLQMILKFGGWIIGIFAFFFLNYSNSFLMRRRKKEFGLYNMLGMGKRHISFVLFWETLMTAVLALGAGLFFGAVLSKAAELCMSNIVGGEISYKLSFSVDSAFSALIVYSAIFGCILFRALWQIRKASAISLLRSENAGEKLPRFYGLWGVLGIVVLAAAYYIAVTIQDPISALLMFFAAVAMVILATYLLFGSGSVLLCKLLQRNRRYYYRANHFVSVSSMAYRMKRTGAGLASICILLTMVLVMLSSTSCLYFGVEDALDTRYPRSITLDVYTFETDDANEDALEQVRAYVGDVLEGYGLSPENLIDHRVADVSGQLRGAELELDPSDMAIESVNIYGDIRLLSFVPLEDYNRMTGNHYALEEDEILIYPYRSAYDEDTLSIRGTDMTFRIRDRLDSFPIDGNAAMNIASTIYAVVPNFEETLAPLMKMKNSYGADAADFHWHYGFDLDADRETQLAVYENLLKEMPEAEQLGMAGGANFFLECREKEREDFAGTFGGLFSLGAILSVVFLFAAVLMIYYKQLTEGYEDQSRFEIMRKIGMTDRDIRRSVNSQMLTVFLLPLLTAGIHLCFAFPMIRLLLMAFNMTNVRLFMETTSISFAVFGLIYMIIYRVTSNAYYSIVSGAKEA